MTDNRYHKPTPEHSAPNRHMGGAYRRSEGRSSRHTGGTLSSTEDIVVQAVKLGYQIADEQIQKGQDIARRLRGASVRSGSGDVGDLVDQGMRLAKQLAVLFVEWTETTAQAPTLLRAAAASTMPNGKCGTDPAPAPPPPIAATVPIEIKSPVSTVVTVVLSKVPTILPDVYPLFASATDEHPLRHVRFAAGARGCVFQVEVPAGQVPGTYRGCAVDRATGAVLGTIAVEVKPS